MKCKNYTKDQFKELNFDKKNKQISAYEHIFFPLHIDELTNLLNELQSVTKIIETHYIFIKKSTKRH